MSGRLFGPEGEVGGAERRFVTTVAVSVYDRGPLAERGERYQAELASYAVVRAVGVSPWEAVRRLVVDHRALLERRWSPGGSNT